VSEGGRKGNEKRKWDMDMGYRVKNEVDQQR
jgi:hypothetical protein